MPLNFPDSPNNGDTYQGYTYNSTVGAWAPAAADTSGVTVYATVDDLPATGTAGDQAFVTASNRLYLWNGSGWYNIALINTTPSISGVSSSYALASDGTPTVVTITATDPEGLPITYSIASDTSGNIATVTSNNNVFTITPSTNSANAGTFSLTFRASDGVNIASAISSFTLVFKVENSNYTTALITSVGTNNAVNNSFVDSSTSSHTITAYGNATQSTFSPYRHGGYSTYFDGSGDYLTIPAIQLGTSPFTIEMWVNLSTVTTSSNIPFLSSGTSSATGTFQFEISSNSKLGFQYDSASTFTTSSGLTADTWHHVAIVREGTGTNETKMYLDGVLAGSSTIASNFNSTASIFVGRNRGNSTYPTGYITDVRVVSGTAVYTSAFTPPTERLTAITNTSLLTCHLPYFADGSTNDHTITVNSNTKTEPFSPYDYLQYDASTDGGSIYFDGSSRVEAPDSADWKQDADFTIEAWVRPTSHPNQYSHIFGQWQSGGGTNRNHQISMDPNGRIIVAVNRSNTNYSTAAGSLLQLNTWHHIAVTLNGTSLIVWVNGKNDVSTTVAGTANDSTVGFAVGAEPSSGNYGFPGFIADTRVVKGTAIYTADFTPPTAPLTAITNTKLLLNGTNAGIIDKSQSVKTLTLNGDVKSSTTQTKYLTSSMAFDGTGDRIEVANSTELQMGTGDFTFEWWWYPTAAAIMRPICINGTGAGSWSIIMYANQTFDLAFATSPVFSSAVSYSINTWEHIAIVRENGTVTCYVDGISQQSATNTTNLNATTVLGIGYDTAATSQAYQGYMSDVRITKGLARYTANFTPPASELQG